LAQGRDYRPAKEDGDRLIGRFLATLPLEKGADSIENSMCHSKALPGMDNAVNMSIANGKLQGVAYHTPGG
jgi:hypothetical protein